MQIKVSGMGNGVPDLFKQSPIKVSKPAGRLKEQQGNISRMQSNSRQETKQGQSEVKKFGSTPKTSLVA
jgi:hypothetical protein